MLLYLGGRKEHRGGRNVSCYSTWEEERIIGEEGMYYVTVPGRKKGTSGRKESTCQDPRSSGML